MLEFEDEFDKKLEVDYQNSDDWYKYKYSSKDKNYVVSGRLRAAF